MPSVRFLVVALCAALAAPLAAAEDDAGAEFPLARSRLALRDGAPSQRRVSFKARWNATAAFDDPAFAGATLRVSGFGTSDGDSGLVRLSPAKWRPLGSPTGSKGHRYDDPAGSAGGVTEIVLKRTRKGGVLRVTGGGAAWRYAIAGPQSGIAVTLTVGTARWCAEFPSVKTRRQRVKARRVTAPMSCPCERFTSTWAAIQKVVFQRNGCTEAACHGSSPGQGQLDLRPEVAYDHIVDVPATTDALDLIEPGDQLRSHLWRKLAKATTGLAGVGDPAMPMGLPPIPENELEALRLWIRAGAPEEGVVVNTEGLLGSCLPPPDPIKIRPAEPPAPDAGIQLHAPPWTIAPGGEDEVCFATWYDLSATIPAAAKAECPDFWGGPTRECFFYNRTELTQDSNSHHSIIHLYKGAYGILDHLFTCQGGPTANQRCNPAAPGVPAPDGADCGAGGTCADRGSVFGPFACRGGANDGLTCDPTGIGVPAPAGADCGARSGCAGRVQSSVACIFYGPPDWGLDVSGTGTQNAPAVGGSQAPVSVNASPPGVFGMLPTSGIVVWNSHAFNLTDEVTTNEQYWNILFAGAGDRVHPFQGIFDSRDIFVQDVPAFTEREYCRTFTLPQHARLFEFSSHTHKRARTFRIWGPGIAEECGSERPIKPASCSPGAAGQQIFTTTDYSDPTVLRFDPPMALDDPDPATRRFKFCARYDNGASDPQAVKRRSTSPVPPLIFAPGGPCAPSDVKCIGGPRHGQLCGGDDRACDSVAGANDGVCDACTLRGGVTTEDEMFILLGSYYVVTP